jgi:hypothetical protein
MAATFGPIRLSHHTNNFMSCLDQGIEHGHGEIRGAHKNYPHTYA